MSLYNFPHTGNYDQDLGFLIRRYHELTKDFIATREDFEKLKNWVNEQVGNPHLQELINNKLDEWLDSGVIAQILLNEFYKMPFITPELYGAVGDGVTDDTKALQDTIDNSRNKIIVMTKKYFITKPLQILNKENFKMMGGTIITNSHTPIPNENYSIIFNILNSNNLVFENIEFFSKNDNYPYLDYYFHVDTTTLDSNMLAFRITNSNNVNISECVSHECWLGTFTNVNKLVLDNCKSIEGGTGLVLTSSNDVTISKFYFEPNKSGLDNYYHAFYLNGGNDNVVFNTIDINCSSLTEEKALTDIFHFYTTSDRVNNKIIVNDVTIKDSIKTISFINNTNYVEFNNVNFILTTEFTNAVNYLFQIANNIGDININNLYITNNVNVSSNRSLVHGMSGGYTVKHITFDNLTYIVNILKTSLFESSKIPIVVKNSILNINSLNKYLSLNSFLSLENSKLIINDCNNTDIFNNNNSVNYGNRIINCEFNINNCLSVFHFSNGGSNKVISNYINCRTPTSGYAYNGDISTTESSMNIFKGTLSKGIGPASYSGHGDITYK